MPINLICPLCQKTVSVPEQLQGQQVKCPLCNGVFTVPMLTPVAPIAVAMPMPPPMPPALPTYALQAPPPSPPPSAAAGGGAQQPAATPPPSSAPGVPIGQYAQQSKSYIMELWTSPRRPLWGKVDPAKQSQWPVQTSELLAHRLGLLGASAALLALLFFCIPYVGAILGSLALLLSGVGMICAIICYSQSPQHDTPDWYRHVQFFLFPLLGFSAGLWAVVVGVARTEGGIGLGIAVLAGTMFLALLAAGAVVVLRSGVLTPVDQQPPAPTAPQPVQPPAPPAVRP